MFEGSERADIVTDVFVLQFVSLNISFQERCFLATNEAQKALEFRDNENALRVSKVAANVQKCGD